MRRWVKIRPTTTHKRCWKILNSWDGQPWWYSKARWLSWQMRMPWSSSRMRKKGQQLRFSRWLTQKWKGPGPMIPIHGPTPSTAQTLKLCSKWEGFGSALTGWSAPYRCQMTRKNSSKLHIIHWRSKNKVNHERLWLSNSWPMILWKMRGIKKGWKTTNMMRARKRLQGEGPSL